MVQQYFYDSLRFPVAFYYSPDLSNLAQENWFLIRVTSLSQAGVCWFTQSLRALAWGSCSLGTRCPSPPTKSEKSPHHVFSAGAQKQHMMLLTVSSMEPVIRLSNSSIALRQPLKGLRRKEENLCWSRHVLLEEQCEKSKRYMKLHAMLGILQNIQLERKAGKNTSGGREQPADEECTRERMGTTGDF